MHAKKSFPIGHTNHTIAFPASDLTTKHVLALKIANVHTRKGDLDTSGAFVRVKGNTYN